MSDDPAMTQRWPRKLEGPHVPDELGYAGPEHLDPAFVAGYEAKQRYDPATDVAALTERGVDGASVVLDMGCGTGTLTLALAPHCRRVIAVDVSVPMLERLGVRAAAAGIANVEVVRAGFLSYEHQGEPVDVVVSRNALHQLPDFWKGVALRRLATFLRPGGLLWLRDLAYGFEPGEAEEALASWFASGVPDPATGYTPEDLATHVRTEFSTFTWLLEPLLGHAGFEVADVEVDRRRTYVRYACLRR